MDTLKKKKPYQETMIAEVGETYEYLRVIAQNNVEIKKLEFLKSARGIIGKLVFALAASIILFFISILLIILMTYGFFNLISSWPYAILSSIGILTLLAIILYLLRGFLFYKFIDRGVDKLAMLDS